jgi:glycosyltransferase involved in cell wall biosynthesis
MDLVGEGEQKAALEARVAAAGQESAIRFHGYLSGEALAGVLATADVGVIPMEPASKVAVPYKAADYLSCGLVLVNSLPGELEVMLDSYACGCSYTAGNIGSLVSALRHWLDDREALDRGKVGARQLFEAEFDATRIYPAMADWVVG